MNRHLHPGEIELIRHAQMRMVTPLCPIKRRELAIAHGWPRNRPHKILPHRVRRNNLTIRQPERYRVIALEVVPRRQSTRGAGLIIGHQPFLHVLLGLHQGVQALVDDSPGVVVVGVLF